MEDLFIQKGVRMNNKTIREVLERLKYPIDLDGLSIDQALASIREMVEGEKKYLIDNLSEDLDEMVEIKNKIDGYNQAIEDILKLLE